MRRIGDVLRHSFLMIAVIITLFPVLYTFLTSLKTYRDIVAGSFFFKPTLINYRRLFSGSQQNFTALGLNSIIVGIFTTIAVIVIGTLAAYSLTRFRWSKIVSDVFLGWLLFVHMIPPITLSVLST